MRNARKISEITQLSTTIFLVVLIVFNMQSSTFLQTVIKTAIAASGDTAVYQEVTALDNIPTTLTTMAWDTTVQSDAIYSINGARTDITLGDAGHYLVTYAKGFETSGGSNRSEVQTVIDLAGSTLAYGRSSCYIRRTQGTNECWNAGSAIIDASASDILKIEAQRTDSNSATVRRMANDSGISLLKLDDTWDYARIREAGGGQTFNSTTFATILWDTDDELDTGSFSRSSGDITLKTAGHYLVTANTMFRSSVTSRRNVEMRLTLDGSEIPGTRTTAYLRGANSTQDHSAVYVGVINATANSVLRLQAACEGATCGNITNVGNQTAITLVKLPDSTDFARLKEITAGQAVDGSSDPILWDTQDEIDSASFSHSTSTNSSRLQIDQAGDYMFFGSFYESRSPTTSTDRLYPHWSWSKTGTEEDIGSFGKYDRGDNGSTGTYSAGDSGGILLTGLTTSDYIELRNTDESTSTDANATFQGNRYAVQALNIASLFVTSPVTSQAHYRWRDDSNGLNAAPVWLAAEDTDETTVEKNETKRLRIETANTGTAAESAGKTYELQFATLSPGSTCTLASSWTGVGNSATDAINLIDTTQYTDADTITSGALANTEAYTFVNGQGKDTGDTTSSIGPLAINNYTELEYTIEITDNATTGDEYCFRLYDTTASSQLDSYDAYPKLKLSSVDVPANMLGEVGTFTTSNGTWQTINFAGSYTTPVVVGTTNSYSGNPALIFEARNVTSTSVEMRVCESDGGLGAGGCAAHSSETVGYLVIDASKNALFSGIEAGTFSTSGEYNSTNTTVTYSESFSTQPYVYTAVQSVSGTEPIEGRLNSATSTGFNAGICEQNSTDGCNSSHGTETLGWIALEPGNEPFDVLTQSGTRSISSSTATSVSFSPAFSAAPVVLVETQTDNGGQDVEIDEATSVTTTGASVRYCELDGPDTCDSHISETVAWHAIENEALTNVKILQDGYRFYENTDAIQPTTALGTEDTAIVGVAQNSQIRLRVAAQVGGADLTAGALSVKLQYGQGSTCSAIATWTDVDSIAGAGIWRGYNNATPADGTTLTASLLDSAGNTLETYEEQNSSTNIPNTIAKGDRGEWDFVIENNGAPYSTDYCFRLVTDSGDLFKYTSYPQVKTDGELKVDIVDGTGASVANPSVTMSATTLQFTDQTQTGTLGTAAELIRVSNDSVNTQWSMTIAATSGSTTLWDTGAQTYDFNDPTASAGDGGDADSVGGQMTIDPSAAILTPKTGCSNTGLTLGSQTSFSEGVADSITLLQAGATASTNCYWDMIATDISQTIPAEQAVGSYSIDMTISIIAI